jgi:hypothetical protein
MVVPFVDLAKLFEIAYLQIYVAHLIKLRSGELSKGYQSYLEIGYKEHVLSETGLQK